MAPALPKWIRSPLSASERRPSISAYEEVDPLNPGEKAARPARPGISVKMLYWIIAGLVMTIWVLAVAILNERGWSLKGKGTKHWSNEFIQKGAPIPYTFETTYNYSNFDQDTIGKMYNRYYIDEKILVVPIPDAKKKYDLPPGLPTIANPHIEGYSPSFIHQFHCITMFRNNFWDLRRQLGLVPANFNPFTGFDEPENERMDHVEHCLDYMRQTVNCWVDTTMEGPSHHDDGQRTNTDGMGMTHKCWDMEAVWRRYRKMLVEARFVKAGEVIAK